MEIEALLSFSSLLSWMVLMFVTGATCFYLLFLRETRASKMLSKIPGPPKLPVFGNALELNVCNTSVLPLLNDWTSKYGRRFVFWIGAFTSQVAIMDKRDVEKVLSSAVHINKSKDYNMLLPWLGTGLLTSRAGKWFNRRKMLTPTFHFRILDDFLDVFNEQSKILTQILRNEFGDGKVFNIFPYVTRCALDIISDLFLVKQVETAMGRKINAQEQRDTPYVKAIYRISELIQYRQMRPWFHPGFIWYNFSKLGREEKRCLQILHEYTEKVIAEKKVQLKSKVIGKAATSAKVNPDDDLYMSGKQRLAFLDLILETQASNQLTDTDIRKETDTFMFEGHDTTASNANWTIFLLGCYPEYQAKVHQELDNIFGDDRERPITSQDMTQMKYLECCIKEALRLYPSVPFIGRSIESDLQLAIPWTSVIGGKEVGKATLGVIYQLPNGVEDKNDEITIPAGSTAFVILYHLHRDPVVFPEPEVYLPDRFSSEAIKGRHPYAYVPFSAGPRNCIGQKFAMMEEKVMMAQFFRNFKVEAAERREDLPLLAELILRPQNGFHVKIFPRS